ncbi:CPBP family intramembrane glutamic endopeptidase [Fodinibius sediminis]|uniref:CAAX protease self-immunity n=1 Tax=Fodinibius sediminis TaxID=1214077 RepID=A0A521BWD4_9BACT|nr:CPBP family intramembrane glutamic endopeptidase [Fodinibius sediminis]SMO51456.1 CAAX protease self-immunity [Fodinibius sediminis]
MNNSNIFIILKSTLSSLFLALLFIYIIGGIWLFPFNFLLPQHFNNFSAITIIGRVIERTGFLIIFLTTLLTIKEIYHNFNGYLPSADLYWRERIYIFSKTALITFLCLTVTYLVAILSGLVKIDFYSDHLFISDFSSSLYSFFFLGIIGHFFVAIGEEMVYRGLIFRYLLQKAENTQVAIVISSLIFSLFHFHYTEPLSFVLAFLGGYLFALIYFLSGTLLYSISIHWTFNLFMHVFTPGHKDYQVNYLNLEIPVIPGWGTYFDLVKIGAIIMAIIAISVLKVQGFQKTKL